MDAYKEMETGRKARAIEAANDQTSPRLACGLPLVLAKMLGFEPYKAPHAPRGTPKRGHTRNRRQERATSRMEYLAGMSLNAEGRRFTLRQRSQRLASWPASDELAEAA